MGKIKDLSGKVFGRLTVLEFSHVDENRTARWRCRCECGNETIVRGFNLTREHTLSCGCLHRHRIQETHTKHGCSGRNRSPEYSIWTGMLQRCRNPKHHKFKDYGERGITVCDEWLDFSNFLRDMGHRPTRNHSVERMNNAVGYCKENCVWATSHRQSRNKRSNRKIMTPLGEMLLCDAAELSGLNITCITNRIKAGWSVEKLFAPSRSKVIK